MDRSFTSLVPAWPWTVVGDVPGGCERRNRQYTPKEVRKPFMSISTLVENEPAWEKRVYATSSIHLVAQILVVS